MYYSQQKKDISCLPMYRNIIGNKLYIISHETFIGNIGIGKIPENLSGILLVFMFPMFHARFYS